MADSQLKASNAQHVTEDHRELSVRRSLKQLEERGGPELKLGCVNRKGMAS